ncbi:PVC-type heme-binding CxxCH protein [Planctomyces sp. SH-PL62]|uniref:PVC-type heme-binding CxxCH protein n=1 Tax=Planctomyces sp. SH-PL62 TaxID=1636152 RepID=UPI00078E7861|nr:PVC-type heme-binding CxxCH protein [Planctomyces sp. SH-PL62]AMV36476.1 HEAT repeat protein [Planctomyces sp. SH-PL62]
MRLRLPSVVLPGLLAVLASTALPGRSAVAEDGSATARPVGRIPEPAEALKSLRVAPGFQVDLFAAEPLVANPVAFHADAKGRFFVVETFRHTDGVTDNRSHMNWLVDDLAARTVADRVAMYRKFFTAEEFARFGVESERIRLVEDRDGDGKADHAQIFAEGFDGPETGIAAGVLARKGDVYFANIPDLWLLRDTDGDGKADVRKSLHTGYGVHVGFLGHDLHGLIFGPDGKLYFSIGDRGFNLVTPEGRKLAVLDSGSVLRCDPDGANLEVVATGLRNPQELAFNDTGDLFTVDNNSDGGDKARFVHIIEGGDSGWRIGYQFIEKPNSRGVWNSEKMWTPELEGKPAYQIPPLANFSDGPSGLAIYPGVGLNDGEKGRFYLSDFRGAAATSGVRSFAVRPRGASFELVEPKEFLWGLQATDCDFGPDGALYVSDWIKGWNKTDKGRIWRVSDPAAADPRVAEVKRLLAEGFDARPNDELGRLLAHPDRRVRQEAQFTLADRAKPESGPAVPRTGALATLPKADREDALAALRNAAANGEGYGRLHAIWGLGQVLRASDDDRRRELSPPLLALLKDPDAEVRAQAARALAEAVVTPPSAILPLLDDESPRVRLYAMLALARLLPSAEVVEPIMARMRAGDGGDPYLRSAATSALARAASGDEKAIAAIEALGSDPSSDVRMIVLLTMRERGNPAVARFLDDPVASIVLEASRAVTEEPALAEGLTKLAALATRRDLTEPVWRRVLAACEAVGQPGDPRVLAAVAARKDVPESIRVEALQILSRWGAPSPLHPITGLYRGESKRPADPAVAALAPVLPSLVTDPSDRVREAAASAAGELKVADAGPSLRGLAADASRPAASRVEALRALDALNDEKLGEVVAAARKADSDAVRAEGLRILARLEPDRAVDEAAGVLDRGSILEKQSAFAMLGAVPGAQADALLGRWLTKLEAGEVPPEIRLDLTEAAAGRESADVKAALARYDALRKADDPLAAYRDALAGGDAARGRRIFREKAEVQCLRCHKVAGDGGEVGPDLAGVGRRKGREYILESIVLPNKQIAEGFESQVLALASGQVVAGVVKGEDDREVRLLTPEGALVVVPKDQIEEKSRGGSAMPEDLIKDLNRREIRDLVEFLDSTEPPAAP